MNEYHTTETYYTISLCSSTLYRSRLQDVARIWENGLHWSVRPILPVFPYPGDILQSRTVQLYVLRTVYSCHLVPVDAMMPQTLYTFMSKHLYYEIGSILQVQSQPIRGEFAHKCICHELLPLP